MLQIVFAISLDPVRYRLFVCPHPSPFSGPFKRYVHFMAVLAVYAFRSSVMLGAQPHGQTVGDAKLTAAPKYGMVSFKPGLCVTDPTFLFRLHHAFFHSDSNLSVSSCAGVSSPISVISDRTPSNSLANSVVSYVDDPK